MHLSASARQGMFLVLRPSTRKKGKNPFPFNLEGNIHLLPHIKVYAMMSTITGTRYTLALNMLRYVEGERQTTITTQG